jgi:hypothetical protein
MMFKVIPWDVWIAIAALSVVVIAAAIGLEHALVVAMYIVMCTYIIRAIFA